LADTNVTVLLPGFGVTQTSPTGISLSDGATVTGVNNPTFASLTFVQADYRVLNNANQASAPFAYSSTTGIFNFGGAIQFFARDLGGVGLGGGSFATTPFGNGFVAGYDSLALFTVPTPAAATLLGLGGFVAIRRRR
ncbi:MAG: VPLPA-CTERM sorting domain-containing protein, partial [Planctomycetota bacterium]